MMQPDLNTNNQLIFPRDVKYDIYFDGMFICNVYVHTECELRCDWGFEQKYNSMVLLVVWARAGFTGF